MVLPKLPNALPIAFHDLTPCQREYTPVQMFTIDFSKYLY